jgi:hypothetical protein
MVMPNIFFDETYPLPVSVEKGIVLTASNMNADKIFWFRYRLARNINLQ